MADDNADEPLVKECSNGTTIMAQDAIDDDGLVISINRPRIRDTSIDIWLDAEECTKLRQLLQDAGY